MLLILVAPRGHMKLYSTDADSDRFELAVEDDRNEKACPKSSPVESGFDI